MTSSEKKWIFRIFIISLLLIFIWNFLASNYSDIPQEFLLSFILNELLFFLSIFCTLLLLTGFPRQLKSNFQSLTTTIVLLLSNLFLVFWVGRMALFISSKDWAKAMYLSESGATGWTEYPPLSSIPPTPETYTSPTIFWSRTIIYGILVLLILSALFLVYKIWRKHSKTI